MVEGDGGNKACHDWFSFLVPCCWDADTYALAGAAVWASAVKLGHECAACLFGIRYKGREKFIICTYTRTRTYIFIV